MTSSKLPKKEADALKQVIKCYEEKKYSLGVKMADQILKKYPTSGETQAMKGLILNQLGKKEEAYELVKLGLRNDVRSHTCWHVYGLLYRSDSNYKEASKCYLNALRLDDNNQNILRDLSFLQVQMRDFDGFIESRRLILNSRPAFRTSWIAYAEANFLGGRYDTAYDVINRFVQGSLEDKGGAYEDSEMLLFQNKCLVKQSKFTEALEHLQQIKDKIVDKLSLKIAFAEMYLRLGRFNDAKEEWLQLVRDQEDNYRFHNGLQLALLQLDLRSCEEMLASKSGLDLPCTLRALTEGQKLYLRDVYCESSGLTSSTVKKIRLFILTGKEFHEELEAHLRKFLTDGVPALYQDILSLLRFIDPRDSSKLLLASDAKSVREHPTFIYVMALLDTYIINLTATQSFDVSEDGDEPPSTLLWTMYLKSHLQEKARLFVGALATAEKCIEHTSTALDMHVLKARLMKGSGDIIAASEILENCRKLDLQDRYLNNQATKYLLQANFVTQAIGTIGMFTKDEGDPLQTLFDLQCSWYELEAAKAYARNKNWAMALKNFYAVQRHFNDYIEDLFDFHAFCLKKTTLRAYSDMIVMLDSVFSHKFFQAAANGAITILLHLIDHPEDTDGLGHLSAAERKKERAKIKKRKEREEKEREINAALLGGTDAGDEVGSKRKKDDDPTGEKLLQRNFLAEAGVWSSQILSDVSRSSPEVLGLVSEVMLRKGKMVLSSRALFAGLRKGPSASGYLAPTLVKFALKINELSGKSGSSTSVKSVVLDVVMAELKLFVPDCNVSAYVESLVASLETNPNLVNLVAASKCLILVDKSGGAKRAAALFASRGNEAFSDVATTLSNALAACEYLHTTAALKAEVDVNAFFAKALQIFPLSLQLKSKFSMPKIDGGNVVHD